VIAKVEPLTPARSLRGPFDYRVPSHMAEVDVGSMLVVPFGRRRVLGVVVDVAARSELPDDRLVAAALLLQSAYPSSTLYVATNDLNTQNKLGAVGLPFVEPPTEQ